MKTMLKPASLRKADKIAVVCLSSGILGEKANLHQKRILEKRLREEFYLEPIYMDNALKGTNFLRDHPEARAADLKQAFQNKSIKMIWSAIGGNDTFKTLPYLMNAEFRKIVQANPKIFMGFSDTTINHLMLNKMGLTTYYGPALLPDVAELGESILPYTQYWIEKLFYNNGKIPIEPSSIWYEERKSYDLSQVGAKRKSHAEKHGFEFIEGSGKIISGQLLGGCLESLCDTAIRGQHPEREAILDKYPIFPSAEEWKRAILFIETSEDRPSPKKFRELLEILEGVNVLASVSGMLVGKPQEETYYSEYRDILREFAKKYNLPTVYNLNFGHNAPRLILPYGQKIRLDFCDRKIYLETSLTNQESPQSLAQCA